LFSHFTTPFLEKVKIAVRSIRPCRRRHHQVTASFSSCSTCRRRVNLGVYISLAICTPTGIGTDFGASIAFTTTTAIVVVIASNRQG
jgi:hypothetical protein